MPAFHEREDERVREKREALGPAIEEAMARREERAPAGEDDLPAVEPYDRDVDLEGADD